MRVPGLLLLLFVILAVQAASLKETTLASCYGQSYSVSQTEAFGASQGGAQIQLAASRPVYYLAAV
jgi:hypothetical protein